MLTPDEEEMIRVVRMMGDKLVELGYATRIVFSDTSQIAIVYWTEKGKMLQQEMKRIFASMEHGKGEINILEIKALFALFLRTDSGDQHGQWNR